MKYKYIPNCHIIDYKRGKEMFVFDKSGYFETDDPKLIDWIKKNKNFLKPIEEETEKNKEKRLPTDGFYNCKKCDYKTTNKGELLQHYKHFHAAK